MSFDPSPAARRRAPGRARLAALAAALPLAVAAAQAELPDFTALVRDQSASVVNISTTETVRREGPMLLFPFEFAPGPRQNPRRQFEVTSLGSGFIITKDGYILTNNHVVEGVDKITVKLSDNREFEARLVGSDPQTDVALLKIDVDEDLPVSRIGDSDNLSVGEWVVAIGSPFGFEQTVTAGIISALNRRLPREIYVPFIQTDAAVNPGNSGGPLMNLDGEVIGINAQIFSRTGNFAGLSFAIPINIAMDIQAELRDTGTVKRGLLGVHFGPVTPETARAFGLDTPRGALVNQVVEESPAKRAGILPGDIIVDFNGAPVEDSFDLPRMVGAVRPGETVSLTVWRDGAEVTLSATIGDASGSSETSVIGLKLEDVPRDELERLGISGGIRIVGFSSNPEDLPAGGRNLLQGDIIVSAKVNQREVKVDRVGDLAEAIRTAKSPFIALLIQRGGNRTFYVPLRLPER